MYREYSSTKATELLEWAFAPLECSIETFDCGNKVRFRVFAADGTTILKVAEVLMQRLQTADGMASIVARSRRQIEGKGFKLPL